MEYVSVQDVDIPALGYGTAGMEGDACREAVIAALELGYRHIDTAQMYDNEDAVGQAITQSDVPREDVFLVTKVHRRNLAHDDVLESTEASLERLDTDYVDLLLIHAPSQTVPIDESIAAMNTLQEDDKVEHIGVSNFSVEEMEAAIDASTTPILTNQVEYHPFEEQAEILGFCIDNDIMLTAYSPVAKGKVSGNETLQEIGDKYGKTEAQVALRWLIQQKTVSAIPKAASQRHREDNIDIFDFELTDEEVDRIFELQGGLIQQLRTRLGV